METERSEATPAPRFHSARGEATILANAARLLRNAGEAAFGERERELTAAAAACERLSRSLHHLADREEEGKL